MFFKIFLMKKGLKFVFLIFFIFLVNVSAYEIGNPKLIVNPVGANQLINGYLNISLKNDSSQSKIKAEILGTGKYSILEILEILNKTNINYDCWYNNIKVTCDKVFYVKSTNENISGSGEKFIGFNLNGENVNVQDLSFVISGENNQQDSCGNIPLIIDLFIDGSIDYLYINPSDSNCSLKFPTNFSYNYDAILTTQEYCDNITLKYTAGKVKVGGIIKLKNFSQLGTIFFKIKTPHGIVKECNTTDYSGDYSYVSCDIDVFVEEGNYEVCVRADVSDTFLIQYSGSHYGLFIAEYKNRGLIGDVNFNSSVYFEQTKKNLINDINNYINSKYNNNCSNGCIIPLFINSTQRFNLKDLNLGFVSGGTSLLLDKFSEIGVEYPKVDTKGFISIPLEVFNVTAPRIKGNYTLKIYFDNYLIATETFYVEDVPIIAAIIPNKVIVNEETEFRIIAYSPNGNIINYEVNWGDGSSIESNSNGIFEHKYSNSGKYLVTVKVVDEKNFFGVRGFEIVVGIDKDTLNSSLNKAINDIENFENNLSGEFYKSWLIDLIELNETKNKLRELLVNLSSGGDLDSIKNEFDNLKNKIPKNIMISNYPQITYIVNWEKINLDNVERILGNCNCDSDSCKKSLALWNNKKLKISGKIVNIIFYNGETKKITVIYLSLINNGNIIVELPSSDIYSYKNFNDLGNAISFNTTSVEIAYNNEIIPYEVNIYATPNNIDEIECEEIYGEPELYEKRKSPLLFISIILIILVIIGLIIIWAPHIIKNLKIKQKEKEKKLFPYAADYYNLFNFVSNSLKSGKKENEIRQQLLNAGWKKQQVDYIIKKVKKTLKIR